MDEYLIPEDIRHFIWDRDLQDNPLEMDLTFSDEEIRRAMRFCAMSFNDLPPFVYRIEPDQLPASGIFIHGVIYHLYVAKLSMLMRHDVDYQGGNMTVKTSQIDHLKDLLKLHKEEFEAGAKTLKVNANILQGFRHY